MSDTQLIGRVVGLFPPGSFRHAVVTLAAGTGLAQIVGVLGAPVLTRLYTPADLGSFSAALAVLGIITAVSSLSYAYAIALPETDREAADLLVLSLLLTVLIGIVTAALITLTGGALLTALGAGALGGLAGLFMVGQVAGSSVESLSSMAVRAKAFTSLARLKVNRSVFALGSQVALGVAGLGAVGLFLGFVTGALVGVVQLARYALRHHAQALRSVTARGVLRAATRYRRFAFLRTPSIFLNTLGLRAPLLILLALYGPEVGGQYALAERVIGLPVSLISNSVAQAFYGHAAPLAREPSSALRRLFRRTLRSLALAAFGPAVLGAILAPLLFPLIFGESWAQAGLFVTIMTPWYFMVFVVTPTGGVLDILERQGLTMSRELLRLTAFGIALLAAVNLELEPAGTVFALMIAGTVSYAAYGVASWRAVAQHTAVMRTASASSRPDGDRLDP